MVRLNGSRGRRIARSLLSATVAVSVVLQPVAAQDVPYFRIPKPSAPSASNPPGPGTNEPPGSTANLALAQAASVPLPGPSCSAVGVPPGMAASTGAIVGTPTRVGVYDVAVACPDVPATVVRVTVASNAVVALIAPVEADRGEAYHGVADLSGARVGQVTYRIGAGTLAFGLALNQFTGAIDGVPNGAGTIQGLVVEAVDEGGNVFRSPPFALRVYDLLSVGSPSISARAGDAFSLDLAPAGGKAPLSVAATGLPAGLSLNGVRISGTPAAPASGTAAVTVTDSRGRSFRADVPYQVAPSSGIAVATPNVPPATVGEAFSVQMALVGGAPAAWSAGPGFPAGYAVSPAGLVTGTPAAAGPVTFPVVATASSGSTASSSFSATVREPVVVSGYPTETTYAVRNRSVAVPGGTAAGGSGTGYAFSRDAGSHGVSVDAATGAFSFQGQYAETYAVVVKATDSEGRSGVSQPIRFDVRDAPQATYPTTMQAVQDEPFTASPVVTNAGARRRFELASGTLPPGISLDGTTGVLSGTTTAAAEYAFRIRLTDVETGLSGEKDAKVSATGAPGVESEFPVSFGSLGVAGAYDGDATSTARVFSGSPAVIVFSGRRRVDGVTANLPNGASWRLEYRSGTDWVSAYSGSGPASGVLFPPVVASSFRLVAPSTAYFDTFRLTTGGIGPVAPSVGTPDPASLSGSQGEPYSLQLVANDATGPVTWRVASGALPAGLTLVDGLISGTPTTPANVTLGVSVTDSRGIESAIKSMKITLQSGDLASDNAPLSAATDGRFYDADKATGQLVGTASSTYLLYDFGKPVRATGVIAYVNSGVNNSWRLEYQPVGGGGYTTAFSGSVTNMDGAFTFPAEISARYWRVRGVSGGVTVGTLRIAYGGVAPLAPTVTAGSPDRPVVGEPFSAQLSADPLLGTPTWTATDLPPGLELDPTTGVVSGTPTQVGEYDVEVKVVDDRGIVLSSMPATRTIKVQAGDLASVNVPNSAKVDASLYDDDNRTVVTVPNTSTYVQYDFGKPVRADGVFVDANNTWRLQYQPFGTTGWTDAASGNSGNRHVGFAEAVSARNWRIRTITSGTSDFRQVRLAFGNVAPLAPSVTTEGPLFPVAGAAFSATMAASPATAGATWSATGLPPGLVIDPATGVVSGTPTQVGEYAATLRVAEPTHGMLSAPATVRFEVQASDLASANVPLSAETDGSLYDGDSTTIRSVPNNSTYVQYDFGKPVRADGVFVKASNTWRLDYQPVGTSDWLVAATGTSNGALYRFDKPVSARNWRFRATTSGTTDFQYVRLAYDGVAPLAPSVGTSAVEPTAGAFFSQALASEAVTGAPAWTVTGLPSGLAANPATGVVSGTVSAPGEYAISARVVDDRGGYRVSSATVSLPLNVQAADLASTNPPVSVSTPAQPSGDVGAIYDGTTLTSVPHASGVQMTLDFGKPVRADGVIADTGNNWTLQYRDVATDALKPLVNGSFGTSTVKSFGKSVTARRWVLTQSGNNSSARTFRLTFGGAAPLAPSANLPAQTVTRGVAASATATSSDVEAGSSLTYSFSGLPAGIVQQGSGPTVSGTPTAAVGTYVVTYTLTEQRAGYAITSASRTVNFVVK